MALFGFSDISFNKGPSGNGFKGPLANLSGNQFTSRSYRYPLDLGSADKGHYMIFYIRQQNNSSFDSTPVDDSAINQTSSSFQSKDILNFSQGKPSVAFSGEFMNKVNSGLGQLNEKTNGVLSGVTSGISKGVGFVTQGIESGLNNLFGQKTSSLSGDNATTQTVISNSIKNITDKRFGALKRTTLTTDSIALYMPDTLNYVYAQGYTDMSPGNSLLGQTIVAGADEYEKFTKGQSTFESLKNVAIKAGLSKLTDVAKEKAGEVGALGAFAATGVVTNPMLELLYISPSFRTFQFDFFFYPRDEREALEVQKIIERIRFHQAPEISNEFGKGFLIPPSEFDIRFYYNGSQNPNIPQIATCVLENINLNYAPNGFTAYEVPNENTPALGRTGMPVSIQMTLQFKEVTYLTKEDFDTNSINVNIKSNTIGGGDRGTRGGF
jgi:hypothetical protein